MKLLGLSRILKEDEDRTVEDIAVGFARATAIKDFVFAVIEGAIVIGALQFAMTKSNSLVLMGLHGAAFTALSLYFISGAAVLRHAVIENWVFAKRHRHVFLWVSGITGLLLSFGFVRFLSNLANEVIAYSIMI